MNFLKPKINKEESLRQNFRHDQGLEKKKTLQDSSKTKDQRIQIFEAQSEKGNGKV